ncbi:MAG: hypothetical protein LBQ38_06105, partial [Spirochaetaceae bacterium]|nr:hypothetical protein [Spirochaetaceae bacterium]
MFLTSKYRLITLLITLLLCLAALLLGLSVAGSFFDIPQLASLPGDFFVHSYGALAFLIPLYFIGAAYLLADPAYRPDRIFMLSASVIPFITLAAGFSLFRDFNQAAGGNRFLGQLGKVGILFCLVLVTLLEGLLIVVLSTLIFPSKGRGKKQKAGKTGPHPRAGLPRLLPSPGPPPAEPATAAAAEPKAAAEPGNAGTKPGIVGAEAAAEPGNAGAVLPEDEGAIPFDIESDDLFGAVEISPPVIRRPSPINLPELKPLASAAAFREAEAAPTPRREEPPVEEPEPGPEDLPYGAEEVEEEGESPFPPGIPPKSRAPGRSSRHPYGIPVEGILNQYPDGQYWIIDQGTRDAAETLRATLEEFHIQAEVTGIRKGPVITMFEILPAPGVKLSKIVNLQDNIALRLAASSVRIVA